MRIAITGPSGFMGSALLDALAGGKRVPGVGDIDLVLLTSSPLQVGALAGRYPKAQVAQLYDDHGGVSADALRKVDVLLHLGWSTVPATAAQDPRSDLTTNVVGGLALLNAATAAGVRRFIFLSSGGTVYGRARTLPIAEDHPTCPVDPYGTSKLAFENYLAWTARRSGMHHLILRPGNVYGSANGPNKPQGVIDHWLASVRDGRAVEVWNGMDVVRDFVHIDDMVEVLLRSMGHPVAEHILNVGTGRGTSLAELADHVRRLTSGDLRLVERNAGPAAVPANVLDSALLQRVSGLTPFTPLEEGLSRVWRTLNDRT